MNKAIFLLTAVLLIPAFAHQAKAETIVYVREGGTGDGSSWENAMGDIGEAILACDLAGGGDVWVAEGIYHPNNNRYLGIVPKPGVSIFGGFPSQGNPVMDDRDWRLHETILSGDNNRDDIDLDGDGFSEANRDENSIRLLTYDFAHEVPLTLDDVVDGLVFSSAVYYGGSTPAVSIESGVMTFRNCVFRDIDSDYCFSVIKLEHRSAQQLELYNCSFLNNRPEDCLLYVSSGPVLISGCIFDNDLRAVDSPDDLPVVTHLRLDKGGKILNTIIDGGGDCYRDILIKLGRDSSLVLFASIIIDNASVDPSLDGFFSDYATNTIVVNSILVDMDMYFRYSSSQDKTYLGFINTILFDVPIASFSSRMELAYNYTISNTTDYSGTNILADPLFLDASNPAGPDGIWFTVDDGLQLTENSPAIDIGENTALIDDIADLDNDGDVDETIPFDVLGNPRLVGPRVDAGAYEFSGIDPNDIDGDGLPDTWEQLIVDADPNDAITSVADVLGTDDFDGDMLSNANELANFTSAIKWDTDGDGHSDKQEIDAGKDPNSALSRPMGFNIVTAIELIFWGTPGKSYQVEYRDSMNDPWAEMTSIPSISGKGAIERVLISFEGENKQRELYRVVESDE